MNKAVIYARVSSKEQQEEGFSIPAQLKLLREYARKNELKVIKEFTDAETAKKAGRTGFNEMVQFLQADSGVKIILCEKTDRLYRNIKDYVIMDDLDLEIHLVKEGEVLSKDSKSHQKFIHGIKVLMAKNYIDNLSEEVKKGQLQKAESGEYPSGAPVGYRNNIETHRIEIEPDEAVIILKAFQLYSSGSYSIRKVANFVDEQGLRGRRGGRISKGRMEQVLKNPLYYGDFRWAGKLYRGIHEPIISKELFDVVQEAFASHNKPRGRKRIFAYSGLLTCGKCGCGITAEIHKGKFIYYHCTGYHGKCGNGWVREEEIEAQMLRILQDIKIPQEVLELTREGLLKSHKDEKRYHSEQLTNLQARYKRIQYRIDKMYEDKLDGIISESFYKERVRDWEQELEEIRANIEKHEGANKGYREEGVKILELAQKAHRLFIQQEPAEKHKLLSFVLSNCTLKDGIILPQYKQPFNLIARGVETNNWREFRDDYRTFFQSFQEPIFIPNLNQGG